LARESAADDIDGDSIISQSSCCEGANVVIDGYFRPMFFQYGVAIFVLFAERHGLHPCAFQSQTESADATE
jgi:hypothetical protein